MATGRQVLAGIAGVAIFTGVASVLLDDGMQGCIAIGANDDVYKVTDAGRFIRQEMNTDGQKCYPNDPEAQVLDRIDAKVRANSSDFDFTGAPEVAEAFGFSSLGGSVSQVAMSANHDNSMGYADKSSMEPGVLPSAGEVRSSGTVIYFDDPDDALGPAPQIFGGDGPSGPK